MTRLESPNVGLAAIVVLTVASASLGQLDNRVNRGNLSSGRALDANFAVGAGRTIPGQNRYVPGRWSEAIVTGNISGLGGLHVPASALGTNSFRISLPSAGLSSFERRSVDMTTVRSGSAGRPVFYYGAAETIADLGQIQRGLNMPGSSRLSTPYIPPSSPRISHRITGMDTSIRPIDLAGPLELPSPQMGVTQRSLAGEDGPRTVEEALLPYSAAADSTLFGPSTPLMPIPSINDDPGLNTTLDQIRANREAKAISDRQQRATQLREDGAGLPELAREPYDPLKPTRPGEEPRRGDPRTFTGEPDLGVGLEDPLSRQPGLRQQPLSSEAIAAAEASTRPPTGLGGDVFSDLTKSLATAQSLNLGDLAYQPPATGGDEGRPAAVEGVVEGAEGAGEMQFEPGGTDRAALARRSAENMTQLAAAAKWAETRLQEPLTTFVGTHQNKLNKYMAAGELALKSGEYYKAALQFDLACTVDRDNPLPWLGRGHALIAAGDYISAVLCLERGIERFPQIAAFRLDLPAIVDQHDVFDVRRADLETRLSSGESYELRFLLGYLELYSGLPESGIQDLQRAAKGAPAGSVISIFPDLVLGHRELPPIGNSRPKASR